MKFSRRVFVLFLFLLSIPVFPQTNSTSGNLKNEPVFTVAEIRTARLKSGILQEIQAFAPKEQAYFYALLGSTFWRQDRKEGIYWLTKGVELGINPATEYKDNQEKLSVLWNLLSTVLEIDAVLANKVITRIKEIKIDESDIEILGDVNRIYSLIAQQILSRKKDENLAFYFAMLSLRGKKPAINDHSARLLFGLRYKNENLANAYFAKLIEAVKNNGRIAFARHYLFEDDSDTFSRIARRAMPDSQAAVLLELMLPYVQKDSEAVKLKKRNDCPITKEWGLKYLEEYKRLLPKKSSLIEQAVIVCENSEIEVWKKPYFYKNTPLKTSRDYFDFAKEINDKKTQANFLMMASQRAGDEKNYRLASSILDIIEKDFRQYNWSWMKIGAISKQIEELFKEDDFDEITRTLESAPPEYRPFITIKVLNFMSRLKPNHREFVADLMNQARTDFNKIDKYSVNPGDSAINPTQFGQLTVLYVKFGFYDEAIMTHEESIKSFNRLSGTLPPEYKDKKIILRLSSFSRFTNRFPPDDLEFFSRYFDRIYENIGIIENSRIRMHERLGLLEKNLEKPPNTYLIPGIPRIIE